MPPFWMVREIHGKPAMPTYGPVDPLLVCGRPMQAAFYVTATPDDPVSVLRATGRAREPPEPTGGFTFVRCASFCALMRSIIPDLSARSAQPRLEVGKHSIINECTHRCFGPSSIGFGTAYTMLGGRDQI